MNRGNDFIERPASELMVDLHVFVVPPELWRDHLRSAVNQVINDTVSAGFLRVYPETTVNGLRDEIENQLGFDVIPRDFVFLKSVGRALTRVKPKQEFMLKAKSFLPPQAYSPEIYILEATPEVRNMPFSGTSSELSDQRYRNGTNGYDPYESQRSTGRSEFSGRDPIPPIQPGQNVNTQTGADSVPNGRNVDHVPISSPKTDSATQTGNNTPIPVSPKPRSRTPGRGANPPRDLRPPPRENPDTSQPVSSQHINSQAHREPVDFRRPPTPKTSWTPTPQNTPSPMQRTPHNSQPPTPTPQNPPGQHIVTSDNVNSSHDPGDTPLPPLSASPSGSAYNGDTSPNRPSSQSGDGAFLPPLSATPPHSPGTRSPRQKHEQRQAKYTNNTSEDSGISDGVDERERRRLEDLLRKEKEEEAQRRRQAEIDEADRKRREWEEEDRKRQEEKKRREEEEERRRWEEEQRRKEEEEANRMRYEHQNRESIQDLNEERRRQEEEENQRLEEERRRNEEDRRRKEEDQRRPNNERFNSPPAPPPREESIDAAAESKYVSKTMKRAPESRLLAELENVKEQRKDMEKKREELVKKAKALQAKTHHRRNQARDMWKRKYFEEKKRTTPLEEQCNKLRQELDGLHRRIMSVLEGSKEGSRKIGDSKPSHQSNLKIQATKLQHDIEDFQRRVENIKMKLTSEMKLRNQAETELRALRAELTQKKINVTLTRSQQYNAVSSSQDHSTPRKAQLLTPKS